MKFLFVSVSSAIIALYIFFFIKPVPVQQFVTRTCPPPPGEYLMRSNCPYDSSVIDGECRVVCPMFAGRNYQVPCQKDSECDCSGYSLAAAKNMACRCAENRCVAVVDKSEVSDWP